MTSTRYSCMDCNKIRDDAYNRHMSYNIHYPFVSITPNDVNKYTNPTVSLTPETNVYKFKSFEPVHDNFYPPTWNPIGGIYNKRFENKFNKINLYPDNSSKYPSYDRIV